MHMTGLVRCSGLMLLPSNLTSMFKLESLMLQQILIKLEKVDEQQLLTSNLVQLLAIKSKNIYSACETIRKKSICLPQSFKSDRTNKDQGYGQKSCQ